jgi:hypothetical protein
MFASTSRERLAFDQRAADKLGVASVVIGLTELLAPRVIKKAMGVGNDRSTTGVLRVLGVRELMHGIDLLTHKNPAPGLWARVVGDVLDSALLGLAATRTRKPMGLGVVFAAVVPVVLADVFFAPKATIDNAIDKWQK